MSPLRRLPPPGRVMDSPDYTDGCGGGKGAAAAVHLGALLLDPSQPACLASQPSQAFHPKGLLPLSAWPLIAACSGARAGVRLQMRDTRPRDLQSEWLCWDQTLPAPRSNALSLPIGTSSPSGAFAVAWGAM